MKTIARLASACIPFLCVMMLTVASSSASAGPVRSPSPADDSFRRQLTTFFADAARLSPTALGNLAQDPATLAQLRERIASLSPEDLAMMQNAFSQVPDWQAAPEALSSAFQRQVLGDEAVRRAQDLVRFRTEVSEFYAVLRMLPPETLKRLEQDPASVADMLRRIHEMPAPELALLQLQMDQQSDWRGLKAELLSSFSPGTRAGLRALADNGPLGERDLKDLGAFRKQLGEFFRNLRTLRPGARASITPGSIAAVESKLASASPEMLFMIKQRADTPALRQAMDDAGLLARAGTLSEADKAELERFRTALVGVYANLGDFTPGDPSDGPLGQRFASLSYEDLSLIRSRLERIRSWKRTLPAIFSVVSTQEGRTGLALAEHGLDARETQALEGFRARIAKDLFAFRSSPGVDTVAVDGALRSVAGASPKELYLMRAAASLLPADDASVTLVDVPLAVSSLTNVSPESVSFNCSCPDHGLQLPLGIGCVSLQFLCNIVAAPINLALAGIEAVVSGLQTAVGAIEGVIDDVANGVQQVIQGIANLPNILLDALQSLFESIANAVLSEFAPDKIAEKLGLVEGFWNSLPPLPQIPCPPDGFNLHPFGEVGDDVTASKYDRYLFIFDKVLDLIPDTEVSLTLKVPAQVLYGGIQYLGVCLQDAAMARSESATAAFRTLVSDRLAQALENQGIAQNGIVVIQGEIAGLRSQVTTQGQALMSQLTQQQQDYLHQLMLQGQDLSNLITHSGQDLTAALHDFQDQDLRLKIEANLAAAGEKDIGFFQLPQAVGGALELVRQVVDEMIQATLDAGQSVHNAERELMRGDDHYAAGAYKAAYDAFASAYREATKND